jgi:hypothetical protein
MDNGGPITTQDIHPEPTVKLMVDDHRIAMYRETLETLTEREVKALFVKVCARERRLTG